MALKTIPWSIQDHIATPERQAGYLEAALELATEENDPGFFLKALGEVAKARGMSDVARTAGVSREGLYKALSKEGDPQISTLFGVFRALDLTIEVAAKVKVATKVEVATIDPSDNSKAARKLTKTSRL